MSLNKKILDELITEVMQEKFSYEKDPFIDLYQPDKEVGDYSASAVFKDLSDQAAPNDELSDADLQYLFDNPDKITTNIEAKLIAIIQDPQGDAAMKSQATRVIKKLKDVLKTKSLQQQTPTQPQIRTAPAEYGTFNAEVDNILSALFKDATGDIVERTKELSKISLRYYKAAGGDAEAQAAISSLGKRRILSEIMLMDYFAEVVKSFDSGTGGYVFEYFLALLTGGKVTGKESGPGQGMGAVDFRQADGTAGSAKYYRDKSNITQASGGFEINVPVNYIVGLKKQGAEQIDKTSRGASDPARIMAIDIYYMQIKRVGDTKFEIAKLTKKGKVTARPEVDYVTKTGNKYSKLDISQYINSGTKLSTIYISTVRTQTYREMIHQAVSGQTETAIVQLEKYIGSLRKAEAESKVYAGEKGTIDDGQKAFDALFAAEQHFEDLVGVLDPKAIVLARDKTQRTDIVEKNQINSLKRLDKLIEQVILYKNTEEK